MSFASETKAELCRAEVSAKCCAVAESCGVLMYCNTFTKDEIRIITESPHFAKRLPKLFRRAFGVQFDILPDDPDSGGKLIFAIDDPAKLDRVFEAYGVARESVLAHHINFGVLEEECCRQSFMRGALLAGGSLTDPEKRYHLELVTDHFSVSRETQAMLLDMGFSPGVTSRSGHYITYFKNSEVIEDFLTTVGAPVAAMEVMNAKIMKDMTNSVNRRVNCDTANVQKTVDAAAQQLAAIESLRERGLLTSLPDKLLQTANMRIENPELSLTELAALFDPPITKSCLSHRLRKLVETARGHG